MQGCRPEVRSVSKVVIQLKELQLSASEIQSLLNMSMLFQITLVAETHLSEGMSLK